MPLDCQTLGIAVILNSIRLVKLKSSFAISIAYLARLYLRLYTLATIFQPKFPIDSPTLPSRFDLVGSKFILNIS